MAEVTIERGSVLILHGAINGNVLNDGSCEIFRRMNGRVSEMQSGVTVIENAPRIGTEGGSLL